MQEGQGGQPPPGGGPPAAPAAAGGPNRGAPPAGQPAAPAAGGQGQLALTLDECLNQLHLMTLVPHLGPPHARQLTVWLWLTALRLEQHQLQLPAWFHNPGHQVSPEHRQLLAVLYHLLRAHTRACQHGAAPQAVAPLPHAPNHTSYTALSMLSYLMAAANYVLQQPNLGAVFAQRIPVWEVQLQQLAAQAQPQQALPAPQPPAQQAQNGGRGRGRGGQNGGRGAQNGGRGGRGRGRGRGGRGGRGAAAIQMMQEAFEGVLHQHGLL